MLCIKLGNQLDIIEESNAKATYMMFLRNVLDMSSTRCSALFEGNFTLFFFEDNFSSSLAILIQQTSFLQLPTHTIKPNPIFFFPLPYLIAQFSSDHFSSSYHILLSDLSTYTEIRPECVYIRPKWNVHLTPVFDIVCLFAKPIKYDTILNGFHYNRHKGGGA